MADIFKMKTQNWWFHTIGYYHYKFNSPYPDDKKRIHRKARKALKRDLCNELHNEDSFRI